MRFIYLFKLVFSFSLDKYPGEELLDHMVTQFLTFWGNSILFSSGWTNSHSHKQCMRMPFSLHPLQHLLFLVFLIIAIWTVWGDISLWFWFVFRWWLVMLNIFSCIHWSSVCLLCRNVRSSAHLIGLFVFWCWVVWALYIFWILTSYQTYHLQISSPIQ